ncbi:MAG: RsmB/NOP family class I SAM-dependent RNA methyltransferase [Prochlorotrichaceae cyanobacterium]
MVEIPRFLAKLSHQLFDEPAERQAFCDRLLAPNPFSPFPPTIAWVKPRPDSVTRGDAQREEGWAFLPPLPWQPAWVDRLEHPLNPGRHPLHDQGYFYCLDTSSVFAARVLSHPGILERFPHPIVMDVCAAPGGKSIMAWRSLQPQYLYCNEVMGKRLGMLHSNLKRCGLLAESTEILNQDPQHLSQNFAQTIEVAIVDAPCSGQSLLAKGEKNPGCFHPAQVNKNANRQKRILGNTVQLLKPGGYLAYMTCTYSLEENEKVMNWFLQRFPQFVPVPIPALSAYQSPHSDYPCYRLFPLDNLGAGSFTLLLQQS